ncbi:MULTISPECIES: hypothetical protein [unclassified Staphylococcus]|uniref:hypothetical protein n=2 Tax=Staphylococcus TaxID=1279 RepID=UPI001952727C|nr:MULTISPECIES: hypothetical protein [unclassified Staphylococcus]
MLDDIFNIIGAFLLYWVVGWGILLAGIGFIIWLIVKNIRSTSSNVMKGFSFLGVAVLAVIVGFIFYNVTHFAIDLDPNRMTKEEKEFQKQFD